MQNSSGVLQERSVLVPHSHLNASAYPYFSLVHADCIHKMKFVHLNKLGIRSYDFSIVPINVILLSLLIVYRTLRYLLKRRRFSMV